MSRENLLVVVMYHFVSSEEDDVIFHNFKGISSKRFLNQIDILHYNEFEPVNFSQLKSHILEHTALPKKGYILTFDDGIRQHYTNVLPILKKKGLEGQFFPVTQPIFSKKMIVMEKARACQYAIFQDYLEFLNDFYETAKKLDTKLPLGEIEPTQENIKRRRDYLKEFSFYSDEERFFRFIRNRFLDENLFNQIIDIQFAKHFSEENYISRFYFSKDEISVLLSAEMIIGNHSHSHPNFQNLAPSEIDNEITMSQQLIEENFAMKPQILAYPFGAYSSSFDPMSKTECFVAAYETGNKFNHETLNSKHIYRIDASSFENFFTT